MNLVALRTNFLCHVLAIVRHQSQSQLEALVDCGLAPDVIDELLIIPGSDLTELANTDFLDLQIDSSQLRGAIDRLRQHRDEEGLQADLLVHGAPRKLMYRLYGLTSEEFARQRAYLGINGNSPRRAPPDPVLIERTNALWSTHAEEPLPKRYMAVYHGLKGRLTIAQIDRAVSDDQGA